MEYRYYIGEGQEADALLTEVRQRSETARAARTKLMEDYGADALISSSWSKGKPVGLGFKQEQRIPYLKGGGRRYEGGFAYYPKMSTKPIQLSHLTHGLILHSPEACPKLSEEVFALRVRKQATQPVVNELLMRPDLSGARFTAEISGHKPYCFAVCVVGAFYSIKAVRVFPADTDGQFRRVPNDADGGRALGAFPKSFCHTLYGRSSGGPAG